MMIFDDRLLFYLQKFKFCHIFYEISLNPCKTTVSLLLWGGSRCMIHAFQTVWLYPLPLARKPITTLCLLLRVINITFWRQQIFKNIIMQTWSCEMICLQFTIISIIIITLGASLHRNDYRHQPTQKHIKKLCVCIMYATVSQLYSSKILILSN